MITLGTAVVMVTIGRVNWLALLAGYVPSLWVPEWASWEGEDCPGHSPSSCVPSLDRGPLQLWPSSLSSIC